MTSVVTTSVVLVIGACVVLVFLVFDVESALVVEGVADVMTELETAEVLVLEGAPEVDDTAEL